MKQILTISFCILCTLTSLRAQPDTRELFHSDFEQNSFSTNDPLQVMIASDSRTDLAKYNEYTDEIAHIAAKIERSRNRLNDTESLEKAFYLVHRKILGWYEKYTTLGEVFENGNYDCLTGTAVFAMLFERLELDYQIYEFQYHTLIIVQVGEDSIMIESTDPMEGFITDQKLIEERIAYYASASEAAYKNSAVGSRIQSENPGAFYKTIGLEQLAGLQYFNLAVAAYNELQWTKARKMIQKAAMLYPSERIIDTRFFIEKEIYQLSLN